MATPSDFLGQGWAFPVATRGGTVMTAIEAGEAAVARIAVATA